MRQRIHVTFISILFAAMLPVTAWGSGFADYPGDRSYHPYSGPAGGSHYSGSLRVEKGMTGDGYYVRAWLDGLRPEDVQVYLQRNRLVLQTTQGDRYGQHNLNARRGSHWQMSFRRQLRLPYDADATRMTTSTENGIIEIYIPRRSQYMPTDPFSGNR
jgi:HSP20 family molecular chaperone IbpA